ncbi:MAG: hypothetical protein LBN97_07835 [Oscillospiraceae bacterium]|jgi:hypothetical protein|nr:hypothetical protein [Oscillospiraceae bacterium]
MQRFNTSNTVALDNAVQKYLTEFPGDMICPLQIWYETLGGYGAPTPEDDAALADSLNRISDWKFNGKGHYEKYGDQPTWIKPAGQRQPDYATAEHIAVQHLFKVNSIYKAPDGKRYKVVLSEVYNLRCFEVDDKGNLTGPMVKIKPTGDLAKSLVAA